MNRAERSRGLKEESISTHSIGPRYLQKPCLSLGMDLFSLCSIQGIEEHCEGELEVISRRTKVDKTQGSLGGLNEWLDSAGRPT